MDATSDATCKLDRVAAKWGVTEADTELRERWAAGDSLRDLETRFNEAVLEAAMSSAGTDALDGEVANLYRLLTDEGVRPEKRIDAQSRLRRHGLDPEELVDDFVSYQTVRTHLNDCLGVSTERDTSLSVAEGRTTVYKLVSRAESVTERTIERLAREGSLSIGTPSVTLSIRVACSECNDEFTFTQLLDRRGCSCEGTDGGSG